MSPICHPEIRSRSRRRIIDLEEVRTELLADEIAVQLNRNGGSILRMADEVGDVRRWRRAARMAGRRSGVAMRTGVSRDGTKVWASEGP